MTRYTGNHCPVCEQAFTDEDDIVVCPDCGTPTTGPAGRRSGACMRTSRSTPPGLSGSPSSVPRPKTAHEATCPNCGTHNQPGAAQCSHCGCPLPKDDGPPDPTRRTRTRRCRSTPATRPPCISPTTAARPRPPHRHLPPTTTAASAAARSARVPSTASGPRTGPPTWAAARCIT